MPWEGLGIEQRRAVVPSPSGLVCLRGQLAGREGLARPAVRGAPLLPARPSGAGVNLRALEGERQRAWRWP